ncbi:MAG: TonB-dependent receptor [Halopseudomonas sabulinigri]
MHNQNFRLNPIQRTLLSLGLAALPAMAMADEPVELSTMVVSATQTEHSQLSAPASVSVITREELAERQINNLADAVDELPGININPSSTYGRKEIKIRGMDSDYTLLLVNGRRINSRDALSSSYANDFDLSAIPVVAIERIEVIRGPMSSLYGADAIGGVVNVILRKPTNETEAAAEYTYAHPTEGDNGDTHKVSTYTSGALIEDKLLANLILEGRDQAAWQSEQSTNPNTDSRERQKIGSVLSNLTWLLTEQQDLTLDLSYNQDERDALWNNSGFSTPRNQQEMQRTSVGLTHDGRWDGFTTRARYYYENVDLEDNSELTVAANGGVIGDINQTNHTLDGQITSLLGSHLLTGGAEYRITELEHNLNLQGGDVKVDQSAAYLQDEIALGDLNLTLSGRVDHHDVYGTEFSPRAYAVYNLTDNWVIKGGAGKAFKAPSIAQSDENYAVVACRGACVVTGNPDLKPETSVSYEVGTLYEADRWDAGITLFYNDIEDMIVSDQWGPGYRPPVMTYSNINNATIQGVELMSGVALTDSLDLTGNYTLVDAKDEDTNEELVQTPQHTANARLQWQATRVLNTFASYQYTGSQQLAIPGVGNTKSDAFHTLDLGGTVQATRNLGFKFGVTNLTNTERDDVASSVDTILMGRTAYVGINYQL